MTGSVGITRHISWKCWKFSNLQLLFCSSFYHAVAFLQMSRASSQEISSKVPGFSRRASANSVSEPAGIPSRYLTSQPREQKTANLGLRGRCHEVWGVAIPGHEMLRWPSWNTGLRQPGFRQWCRYCWEDRDWRRAMGSSVDRKCWDKKSVRDRNGIGLVLCVC